MMTDAFIRGWQTTHGVSGCLHEKTRTGASLIPRGFIKVLNRRATEFDTRAKNWQGPPGLDP